MCVGAKEKHNDLLEGQQQKNKAEEKEKEDVGQKRMKKSNLV